MAAGSSADVTDAAGETISFEGPWAADFAEAYTHAGGNGFVRDVLADGIITDQEVAEASSKFRQCLEDAGFTDVEIFDGGGYGVGAQRGSALDNDDLAFASSSTCESDSGFYPIANLAYQLRRNPDRLDEDAIMAECLVRKGMAESGYSADDYALDMQAGKYLGPAETVTMDPEDVGSGSYTSAGSMGGDVSVGGGFEVDPRYEACSADPLGLGE